MKRTIALLSIGVALIALAAPLPNTVTVNFKWVPDNTQMAGLSTNDYCTNITALVLSTVNVNQPTNQWPVVAILSVASLLSQGPPGTIWTNQLQMDGNARFYAIVMTNGNGGSSPFSNLAPGLTAPTAGTIPLPLKVQ
jgi:hypothetical protein